VGPAAGRGDRVDLEEFATDRVDRAGSTHIGDGRRGFVGRVETRIPERERYGRRAGAVLGSSFFTNESSR